MKCHCIEGYDCSNLPSKEYCKMKFTWTNRLIFANPLIMLIAIITAAGGHGTPIPMILCYPMLFLPKIVERGDGPWMWAILIAQFPIYGLLLDLGKWKSRRNFTTGLRVLVHVGLILFAVKVTD